MKKLLFIFFCTGLLTTSTISFASVPKKTSSIHLESPPPTATSSTKASSAAPTNSSPQINFATLSAEASSLSDQKSQTLNEQEDAETAEANQQMKDTANQGEEMISGANSLMNMAAVGLATNIAPPTLSDAGQTKAMQEQLERMEAQSEIFLSKTTADTAQAKLNTTNSQINIILGNMNHSIESASQALAKMTQLYPDPASVQSQTDQAIAQATSTTEQSVQQGVSQTQQITEQLRQESSSVANDMQQMVSATRVDN